MGSYVFVGPMHRAAGSTVHCPTVLMPSKLQGSEMPSSRPKVNKIGVSNAYITLPISSRNLTTEAR